MDTKDTVLGFMFTEEKDQVLLIEKYWPEWMRGKYNGLGGKIEEDEGPASAMVREFEEECGLLSGVNMWEPFLEIRLENGSLMHVFRAFSGHVTMWKQTEQEAPQLFPVNNLPENLLESVEWMINEALGLNSYSNVLSD